MSFSTSTDVEDRFTYPSVTVCITMDNNFTGNKTEMAKPGSKMKITIYIPGFQGDFPTRTGQPWTSIPLIFLLKI